MNPREIKDGLQACIKREVTMLFENYFVCIWCMKK